MSNSTVAADRYQEVTVLKKANVYFEGKVTSRTILFADGTKKTLGIMMPGDYEFGTDVKELMEIQAGKLDVLLPDQTEWLSIEGEGEFYVPANASFKLRVHEVADYCCSYITE
ncbi:pyrimidine/purine nucleoside phosphorylase [Paenibacillus agilis]|uniref:Pyrimidine/purine nucleoside phosphorylase n=1 Tax=Paenibacillus agilis TaxID=3020863 RepID=A0A559IWE8_9BACL|nr:pyrimidine/purine nucleoside phosphorylase [Paenibacillus agilis]TVX91954.1 pyrimidine/purine nucleoside phosphorylase [Paenibacillus agilis]